MEGLASTVLASVQAKDNFIPTSNHIFDGIRLSGRFGLNGIGLSSSQGQRHTLVYIIPSATMTHGRIGLLQP